VADTENRKLLYVHVGDTRLYRFRQQELEKITHDHSMVGLREDANQLTEREAMHHPRRNEILRDVGSMPHRVDDPDFLESGETDFQPGDRLLLCSDGLTDMVTRAQITEVLTQKLSVEEQITELIRQANEQGGNDNITVVLAEHPVSVNGVDEAPRTQLRTSEAPPELLVTAANDIAKPTTKVGWAGWAVSFVLLVALIFLAVVKLDNTPATPQPTDPPSVVTPPDSATAVKAAVKPTAVAPDSARPTTAASTTTTKRDSVRRTP
jgi:hypothetical protein